MRSGKSFALYMALLCAATRMFAGCKDLFHPDTLIERYTVTFCVNTETLPYSEKVTVKEHTSLGSQMPPVPYKNAHVFDGWWTEESGGGTPFTSATPVENDTTVYANWTLDLNVRYKVTFNLDQGDIAGDSTAPEVYVSNSASLGSDMPPDPHRKAHIFNGWWTEQNGGGTEFTAQTPVTTDITLYANWTLDPSVRYKVTFNLDQGDIAGDSSAPERLVFNGASLDSDMPPDPHRDLHSFGGWWTEESGGGAEFTSATLVEDDTTVYAHWIADVPVETMKPEAGQGSATAVELFVNEVWLFSVDKVYSSYQWYWDGNPINGATSNLYSWDAYEKPSGVYELSVRVASEQGELSARCRVTIKDIKR